MARHCTLGALLLVRMGGVQPKIGGAYAEVSRSEMWPLSPGPTGSLISHGQGYSTTKQTLFAEELITKSCLLLPPDGSKSKTEFERYVTGTGNLECVGPLERYLPWAGKELHTQVGSKCWPLGQPG
ncbi:hypothetical protein F4802DRAFT_215894 [Xylaria palmicola]|nr:hypothetical protein F4802DRAFT_215894 [Xylaria palmicola]